MKQSAPSKNDSQKMAALHVGKYPHPIAWEVPVVILTSDSSNNKNALGVLVGHMHPRIGGKTIIVPSTVQYWI